MPASIPRQKLVFPFVAMNNVWSYELQHCGSIQRYKFHTTLYKNQQSGWKRYNAAVRANTTWSHFLFPFKQV